MNVTALSRATGLIYNLLVVELLLLLTTVPTLAAITLLDHDVSNVPLVAVCAIPLGPAVSAALYALRHGDDEPATAFWRGYRGNALPVLKLWLPLLAWLTILAVNLANFSSAGVPGWWGVLLAAVAVAVTLWAVNALVITSLFTFRTVDAARLALHFLPRGATLANAGVLIAAGGVTLLASEAVTALLGSLLAGALLWNSRAMTAAIRDRFTA
ncbi:hypothetical protein OHA72_37710 [Dactylosporangium sp. NBC_01737]|uniref:hypothetical protein n=1 Tax=Dactylosporangium sp. NBC_01737 TaxID=2975959 RepID=UPI002E103678|nr:hypothetical protein OHA72_37710 [Dactylosporangium sp. NBC_01737]